MGHGSDAASASTRRRRRRGGEIEEGDVCGAGSEDGAGGDAAWSARWSARTKWLNFGGVRAQGQRRGLATLREAHRE
jgi:hypothetical protein